MAEPETGGRLDPGRLEAERPGLVRRRSDAGGDSVAVGSVADSVVGCGCGVGVRSCCGVVRWGRGVPLPGPAG